MSHVTGGTVEPHVSICEGCSVLQCVTVCCRVWQCVAVCCSVLQCLAVCCSAWQCVAVRGSVLQCVAVCCNKELKPRKVYICMKESCCTCEWVIAHVKKSYSQAFKLRKVNIYMNESCRSWERVKKFVLQRDRTSQSQYLHEWGMSHMWLRHMTWQVENSDPEEFKLRKMNKLSYRYPRGESYVDVIQRLDTIIHELERQRYVCVHMYVVCSGCHSVIECYRLDLIIYELERQWHVCALRERERLRLRVCERLEFGCNWVIWYHHPRTRAAAVYMCIIKDTETESRSWSER